MESPYTDVPVEARKSVTERLIGESPLTLNDIRELVLESWHELWQTQIGVGLNAIPLSEIKVPAPVIGYFFEKLFIRNLLQRQPRKWRGGQEAGDKDVVYLADDRYSIEIKTSGQLGTKIFGNRSYGQQSADPKRKQKEKSGYYITVNFFGMTVNLIRFGWLDHLDWKPQRSPTGPMAGLTEEAYRYKLLPVHGDYQLTSSVLLLKGIGKVVAAKLSLQEIETIGDLMRVPSSDAVLLALQQQASTFLGK